MKQKNQQGSALIMVMICVLVLMLGAMAAIRSTESANLIAGNSAFAAATKQAADVGSNQAYAYVLSLSDLDTGTANKYFPMRQSEDAYGIPATVDWARVETSTVSNYTVQYVIERLCIGPNPVTDIMNQCVTDVDSAAGSKKLGSEVYASLSTIAYRITVRTRGPKNAEAYTQTMVSR